MGEEVQSRLSSHPPERHGVRDPDSGRGSSGARMRAASGGGQARTAPGDNTGRFRADLSLLSGNKVHPHLAQGYPSL